MALLVLLIVFVYGYEFIFNKPIIESPTIEAPSTKEKVEIKEQYKDSTYTFGGTVDVPTPCHSLATKTNKVSETKYLIIVDTISPKQGVVCAQGAQVISQKSYKVSFEAPANIEVTVIIDGVEYQTNRFLVPLNENIDLFQLEVKG